MWPRAGGHVGPPTPLTPEVDRLELMPWRPPPSPEDTRVGNALTRVLPSRSSTQNSSSSCESRFTLPSTYAETFARLRSLQDDPPPQPDPMPLEPRNSPRRSYQRMYRRAQHPYRLLSLNERMHRFRPILPSLQEEEAPDPRSNIVAPVQPRDQNMTIEISDDESQDRPVERVLKRERRTYNLRHATIQITTTRPVTPPEVAGAPRDSIWIRPEILITSDVQLQTEDIAADINTTVTPRGRRIEVTATIPIPMRPTHSQSFAITATTRGSPATADGARESNASNVDRPVVAAYIDIDPESDPTNAEGQAAGSAENVEPGVAQNNPGPSVSVNQAAPAEPPRPLTSSTMIPLKLHYRSRHVLPIPSYKAKQVANSVIKHARHHKTLDVKALYCLNCDLFPEQPVTGSCGHTRCIKCIEIHGRCPCGVPPPSVLHVNTVIQYLIGKMLPSDSAQRGRQFRSPEFTVFEYPAPKIEWCVLRYRKPQRSLMAPGIAKSGRAPDINSRLPMIPQVQFEYAQQLMKARRYLDAAPHYAGVAASSHPRAKTARSNLAQIITILAESLEPRHVTRQLFRSVRLQAAGSWLKPSDLECVLCYHTYERPITTPCGHTYCRTCIERALDYRKVCALCLRPLDDFDLGAVRENVFVMAALESIDASRPPLPPDPDVIPIFVCTVAYPSIPCPLFIFDPRYWLMIRRVLESGSRKFGMVAYERDRNYSDYGTILEVCDCVHLEDGRSFLSTVGVSRFRVIDRDVRDGCDVARIQPLTDITPTDEVVIFDMRCLGSQILFKALVWLNGMNRNVRAEIETAFGEIPRFDDETDAWWDSPDGPAWLWWLIAILPLRSEIKVLILSTKNLMKRMLAVSRTLEAIDQVAITTTATSECEIRSALTNAEEWLERGS